MRQHEKASAIFSCSIEITNYNPSKHVHTSPQRRIVVISNENNYAFNVLSKIQTELVGSPRVLNHEVDNLEEFNSVLDQNWRASSVSEIVKTFKNVKKFCMQNNIDLSDKRFDKLVDGVMDNCENLTINEIADLLNCMAEMPITPCYDSHNFHDLWSCLDDICCWKMVDWNIDTSLEIAKLWYKLHLGKHYLDSVTFLLLCVHFLQENYVISLLY